MEFTVAVVYHDNMVYYNVFQTDGSVYEARLLKSKDHPQPPQQIQLYKDGQQWHGNADDDLIQFLGYDIDLRQRYRQQASL